MCVRLHEPAGPDPGAELGLAGVADRLDLHRVDGPVLDVGVRAAGGEQSQEVGLARAVAAQHRDPLAVPDLEVERLHQAGRPDSARHLELQPLAHHRALAGATTLETHGDLLLARLLGRRTGLLELAQAGLGGLVLRGHAVVVLGLDPQPQHERLDLRVLLVPAPAHLLEAREPVAARVVVRREPAGMRPRTVAAAERAELDGDDPGGRVVEQLPVVADEQDGLVGLADPILEPDLARARRGSCRARRAAAPRRGPRGGTRARAASAHRRSGWTGCGTSRGRRAAPVRARCRRPRRPRGRSRRRRRTPRAPRRSGSGSSRRRSPSAPAPSARRRPRRPGPGRARPRGAGRRRSGRHRGRSRPSGASPRGRRSG